MIVNTCRRARQYLNFSLLPPRCILCDASGQSQLDLCAGCQNDFPALTNSCQQCAFPLALEQNNMHCGQCIKHSPYFDETIAAWHYEFPIRELITQFKFTGKLAHGRVLATVLAQQLQSHYQHHSLPDAIIPVPLHPKRLRERGFNQSKIIGKFIQAYLPNVKLDEAIKRTKNTRAQFELSRQERKHNIRDAFSLKHEIKANHVAIIDDVMTTASTVNEMSRLLKQQTNVRKITVWCLARAHATLI